MRKTAIILGIFTAMIIGCKSSTSTPANSWKIDFQAKSGSSASGSALFSENGGKVTLTATISGLKPGVHAIHIHEKSDCSAPDATSAGGHWNPTFKSHGKWGSSSYHKGDIGNFTTDTFGTGTITFTTDEWCIGCGDASKDILGKSLIIHESPDDFITQPTGAAGARMACSAIIR